MFTNSQLCYHRQDADSSSCFMAAVHAAEETDTVMEEIVEFRCEEKQFRHHYVEIGIT